MRTRAERRHHRRRMMNKVKNYSIVTAWPEEYREHRIQRHTETRHPCSCSACGNPRHSVMESGDKLKTMQERRMDEYEKNLGIDDD
jgi:hypothetical protein